MMARIWWMKRYAVDNPTHPYLSMAAKMWQQAMKMWGQPPSAVQSRKARRSCAARRSPATSAAAVLRISPMKSFAHSLKLLPKRRQLLPHLRHFFS
jgi:hypothetical protein